MPRLQRWEYLILERTRKISEGVINYGAAPWDFDIPSRLNQLGNEGWELIAVTTRSSAPGSAIAGATTDEVWIFKRPTSG